MVELTTRTPAQGLFPIEIGDLRAIEVTPAHMSAVQPFAGKFAAASAAVEAAHGMALPGPGRATGREGARAVWFGRDCMMLIGPAPDATVGAHAAVVDQSDAWAMLRLEGPGAREVLARLTPLDVRESVFKRGHTARTELAHMAGSVTRVGRDTYQLMVFRSMAHTIAHDLRIAMRAVAGRAGA